MESNSKKESFAKRFLVRPLAVVTKTILVFLIINSVILLFFRFINPASTAFIYSNVEDFISSLFSTSNIKYQPVPLGQISKYALLAVIASEDQRFYEHFGFDFEQIEKAIKENTYRKRKRGASTITMQVAKNLFLWPGKSLMRKGVEAFYTAMLEILWSKNRIGEVYLNIAEMGKGIYGVRAASEIYYKKKPIKLNMSEAATLAAILPNPKKRNPARPSGYVIDRRQRIMTQMNQIGGLPFINKYLD